jgi:hypothetical protein
VMDGTMAPVRRIVAGAELVLAVWQDQAQDHGVDLLPIKGAKLLSEIVASGTAQNTGAGCRAY